MADWFGHIARLEGTDELDRSVDEVLRLLSHRLVRGTIIALYNQPETTLEELAGVLATREAVDRETIATQRDVEKTKIELHHITLPRLAESGWIAFDPDAGTVTETGVPDLVFAALIEDADHG